MQNFFSVSSERGNRLSHLFRQLECSSPGASNSRVIGHGNILRLECDESGAVHGSGAITARFRAHGNVVQQKHLSRLF